MLVKRDSASRLALKIPGSWSKISLANLKLCFSVYLLVVIHSRRGNRNLARLYVGLLIADIIDIIGCFTFNWEKFKIQKVNTSKRPYIFCNYFVTIDEFKILATSDSDFRVKVKESLLISRGEPILNKK